ncbi:hypothetical protein H9S87_18930 (plasmid) [Bacillus pumilus]|uniref:hypothetical protein n=1 Tax=Bacillus pumilus TaxID=1408 RepID=UPI001657688C|nr:hypothetical protein [Bacillus pumilus]QNP18249.1 hypothetical protein H9S87_18930 [Bacillus pumilus]
MIDDRLVIDLRETDKDGLIKGYTGKPEYFESNETFYQNLIGSVNLTDEQLTKIELEYINGGLCHYCGESANKVRPLPFMGDISSMCKDCWDMTKKEYAASHDEHIGEFEDYPHWKEQAK